jgi:hypothetical protein
LGYLLASIYVIYNSIIALETRPLVNVPTLPELSSVIASNAKANYNVVYTPEAEYRAYTLRYILTSIYHTPPMPVEAYPSAEELYVVALAGRDLNTDIPWEISSFKPTIKELIYTSPDKSTLLYKLTK